MWTRDTGLFDGKIRLNLAFYKRSHAFSRLNVTTWSTSARMPIHSPNLWSWWLGTWAITVWPLAKRRGVEKLRAAKHLADDFGFQRRGVVVHLEICLTPGMHCYNLYSTTPLDHS